MNDSRLQLQFERYWTRGVVAFVIVFSAWFVISEREGLARLLSWTWNGIASAPTAISDTLTYYAELPPAQWLEPLVIGALAGAVMTLYIVLPARARLTLPPLPLSAWGLALGAGAGVIGVGLPVLLAVIVFPVVLWGAGYALSPGVRAFLADPQTRRALTTPAALRGAAVAGGVGIGGGALGSQLLTYATQHCTYSPEAPAVQYQMGVALTLAGALVFLLPFWTILKRGEPRAVNGGRSTSGFFRSPILPYLLLAPTIISLLLFLYYPGVQTLLLSLRMRRFPLPQEQFVCLGNYVSLAQDTIYQNSFLTTLSMTVVIVLMSLSMALGIAVLASQKIRGASIYRTLLIWPFALSPIVAGTIFLGMFRSGGSGLINALTQSLFGVTFTWLSDPVLAPWVVVLASVWNILGFNILFYIAGLQNVPKDLTEAAQIDGANRLQAFVRIVFPMLAPYTFFLLVTNVTYSFYGIYGAVDALTRGGPPLGPAGIDGGATNVLIFKLYADGFSPGSPIGMAAAQALILFVMVAGLTVLQFRVVENRITYSE